MNLRPGKRSRYSPGHSRENPIIIKNDEAMPPRKRQRKSRGNVRGEIRESGSLQKLLGSSRNIIVISGAGISANAGFPTFQDMHKSKATSFHRSLYSLDKEIIAFHSTVCAMFKHRESKSCQLTGFHKMLGELADNGQILLHVTQNIDYMEQMQPALETRTVRLHGQINQSRCQICNQVSDFRLQDFQGIDLPECRNCIERNESRTSSGKRGCSRGELRPDVLLYDNPHPDNDKILAAIEASLTLGPEVCIVTGTRLKVLGTYEIAKQSCDITRRNGGFTVWINKEKPSQKLEHLFDYIIVGDCDLIVEADTCLPSLHSSSAITLSQVPRASQPTFQQLRGNDDILTNLLVDQVYGCRTRKFDNSHKSTDKDRERVVRVLRDAVIEKNDFSEAERLLLTLPGIHTFSTKLESAKERYDLMQHMRRYLKLYLPDCPFEISSTSQYTRTASEATVISRSCILKGDEIKYLCGIRAVLTEEEVENLDKSHNNFSIIFTTRQKATSALGGLVRYVNHDCDANARLNATGKYGVAVIATKDIEIGDEITVEYAKNYFGDENCNCLCRTCEDNIRNGWARRSQDPRTPGDYPCANLHIKNHVQRNKTSLLSCPACVRHKELYGYCWPKTQPKNRQDIEKRVY